MTWQKRLSHYLYFFSFLCSLAHCRYSRTMYSLERNFIGNNTTLEIILFEVPLNRCSSTGGVRVVGKEYPQAKAESKK